EHDRKRGTAETDFDMEPDCEQPPEPENWRKNKPPQQLAEVVTGGAQDGVDFVAFLTGQIVAVHAIVTFQVTDRRLDGRTTFEHAANGARRSFGNRTDHVHTG